MKKILVFLLVVGLVFSLACCQKTETKPQPKPQRQDREKKKELADTGAMQMAEETDGAKMYYKAPAGPPPQAEPAPLDYNREGYDKIDENPFLPVIGNALSTFSIDVDTASYANMRRFLNNSNMPPKDAVRIEELVNYFNYQYDEPEDAHPFSLALELAGCPWNSKHQLLRIALKGKDIDTSELPPANLVFLLDVSGSMNAANKLPLLKKAFKILVEGLRPQDRVAMVVYAGAAGVVLDSTPGNEKQTIVNALDRLNAGGSTAGGAGIALAYKIAQDHLVPKGNNRVILATDGDFNVGASSDSELVRMIEEKRESGIFLTILGFGMGNYQDAKMEKLSNAGNGNYAYIDNILEARKVLGQQMWGTLYAIAKDVKIQVEFNPAQVKAYRLIGYENRMLAKEDFADDKKDAGEIGAGHRVTAFYELIPAGSDEEVPGSSELKYQETTLKDSRNLLTVRLRYKPLESDKSLLIEEAVSAGDVSKEEPSVDFRFASAVAEFGLLLRDSPHKGQADYAAVLKRAQATKGDDPSGYRAEFIRLVQIADSLK